MTEEGLLASTFKRGATASSGANFNEKTTGLSVVWSEHQESPTG